MRDSRISCAMMGGRNASVFPEPVPYKSMTSRPLRDGLPKDLSLMHVWYAAAKKGFKLREDLRDRCARLSSTLGELIQSFDRTECKATYGTNGLDSRVAIYPAILIQEH